MVVEVNASVFGGSFFPVVYLIDLAGGIFETPDTPTREREVGLRRLAPEMDWLHC